MHIAHIVPTKELHTLKDNNQKYYMLLAQELIRDMNYFMFHYKEIGDAYKILDNGAYEGSCLSIWQLLSLGKSVQADDIVLPDVLFDAEATLSLAREATNYIKEHKSELSHNYMFVVQGKTIKEMIHCYKQAFLSGVCINIIGIPKHASKLSANARGEIIQGILDFHSEEDIPNKELIFHLLGCAETPLELGLLNMRYGEYIRSCDTALAYVYARNDMYVNEDDRPENDPINFQEEGLDDSTSYVNNEVCISSNKRKKFNLNMAEIESVANCSKISYIDMFR